MTSFTPIWALGLMSGTSMDGIDAALLRSDGETIAEFGAGLERPWRDDLTHCIDAVMRQPLRYRTPANEGIAAELAVAEQNVELAHAEAVMALLSADRAPPEVIGFHGQTVYHAPHEGWTWQIGDGGRLARMLNRNVVWDFRSNDMRAGGQGAPLAPFYHFALARHIGATEPVCFLNIGGVANVTWVDPHKAAPEDAGALLAFDTGPGNALLNDWMLKRTGEALDRDGAAAAAGIVDWMLVGRNSSGDFFKRTPPKSLDRNEFSLVLDGLNDHSTQDGAATLTALTVEAVREAQSHLPAAPSRWLVCGGGRRNPVMMQMLGETLDAPVEPVEAAGLDGDLLEAQAFAYLAVRSLRGLPLSAPGTTACNTPVTGGRISQPDA